MREKQRFPFDYSRVDWHFVAQIMDENSLRLSRTRKGIVDTGASHEKLPLLLTGDELRRQSADNEQRVYRFILDIRGDPAPSSAAEVQDLLFTTADMTNAGLLPAGRLRTWSIAANQASTHGGSAVSGPQAKVAPEDLPAALDSFCQTIYERWAELTTDPLPLAAWAEWELNGGSLHPFYDGCSRISRAFGAMLLIRGATLLPLYDDPTSYFAHGNQGIEIFTEYVWERICTCAAWVGTWHH